MDFVSDSQVTWRRPVNLQNSYTEWKQHTTNDTYKVVDIVGIVNDGADLTMWTNGNSSKNVGTRADKLINLKSQQSTVHVATYFYSIDV